MSLLLSLAVSLAATLLLELLFAFFWRIPREAIPVAVLVNVLTNPVVVLLHQAAALYLPALLLPVTVLLEAAAILTEGRFYATCTDIRHPGRFSLCANLFSFLTGLLLF